MRRKSIRRTDLKDALNRLDKLMREQSRMAIAEVQRATDVIDETVWGVTEQVVPVEDRVVSVNDEISELIDGVQIIINLTKEMFNLNFLDGEEANRLLSPNLLRRPAPLPSAEPHCLNEREQSDLSLTATSSDSLPTG